MSLAAGHTVLNRSTEERLPKLGGLRAASQQGLIEPTRRKASWQDSPHGAE